MTLKETIKLQLDQIKSISTDEEWLVFVLAYYEKLSILEISKVLNREYVYINKILDNVLLKAVPILGPNVQLL
ncbi:MAG: hypothetical protein IJZ79_03085 [Bacilli bacterium]|nr:hypothetical protein [Bacilli bacterium]MBQ8218711.1 hypothetical protein [Bacilli bacterium]